MIPFLMKTCEQLEIRLLQSVCNNFHREDVSIEPQLRALLFRV